RFANGTAVQHFQQALSLIEKQSDRPSEPFFRAKIGLGQTLKFLGNYTEIKTTSVKHYRVNCWIKVLS
ncbi:hypothetical protein, partial [Psychromonas sp.]|uniref:hypothetical protein n=1 Tax=Psychromonas sp. TaxID=1884585 RepID=UPI0035638EA3